MSEPGNQVEELKGKISNLENDVATLTGENSRLNTDLKNKINIIDELRETQKSLEAQIKAAARPQTDSADLKAETDRQAQHIIDLEAKLKGYQEFELSKTTLEKQLKESKQKADNHLKELVESKAKHELEVKQLRSRIAELSTQPDNDYNSDLNQLVEIKI